MALLLLLSLVTTAQAQEPAATADPGKLEFVLEPYLMFPNMQGTVGVRGFNDIGVDASAGDIFDNLQFGFMLYAEARNDTWAFTSDLLYMDLGQDATPSERINSGNVEIAQFAWEFAGLRRVNSFLEVGLGGRVNSLYAELDLVRNTLQGGTSTVVDETGSANWFDPVIITRASKDLGKWRLQFRGDIGGFGVGSDLTYQLQGYVGYRFSPLFQLTTGYRLLDMDYEKESGDDLVQYDMAIFGPMVRMGFWF